MIEMEIEKLLRWALVDELPKGHAVETSTWDLVVSYSRLGARVEMHLQCLAPLAVLAEPQRHLIGLRRRVDHLWPPLGRRSVTASHAEAYHFQGRVGSRFGGVSRALEAAGSVPGGWSFGAAGYAGGTFGPRRFRDARSLARRTGRLLWSL